MKYLSGAPLVFILHASLCVPNHLSAANINAGSQVQNESSKAAVWKSASAEHVYGFPDMKPHKKGAVP
jgi:hypothetical protein